jgi:hypothetical protein
MKVVKKSPSAAIRLENKLLEGPSFLVGRPMLAMLWSM